ncbi:ABC transporter substrate-binding protein [Diaphorobacter nitroreducens]|uniref:ABC transporter substrate-binding protein n=1 Tax=Diaphorobacter nitroreducens TaxID=164759 RepID=UPI0035AF9849
MSNLPMRRRTVATAMAATALGMAAPLVRAQTTKVRVSTIPIIDIAPMQVAVAKGYFAAEGIEVDTTPTQGGAAGIPALAAGQVQIVFGDRKSNRMSTSIAHVWGVSGMHTGDCWVDFSKPVARDFSV